MTHFLAIFLRSVLLLALIANGTLASVHAHRVNADSSTAEKGAGAVMPCHEEMTADFAHAIPARNVDQHACCGAACVCDFVISSTLATIAWMSDVLPVESLVPTFSAGELLSPNSPRLLRPPIA